MMECWKDSRPSKYESLYNSAGTASAVEDIKTRLRDMITTDSLMEVNKITAMVVKEAMHQKFCLSSWQKCSDPTSSMEP